MKKGARPSWRDQPVSFPSAKQRTGTTFFPSASDVLLFVGPCGQSPLQTAPGLGTKPPWLGSMTRCHLRAMPHRPSC
jgi:hypothetical protein